MLRFILRPSAFRKQVSLGARIGENEFVHKVLKFQVRDLRSEEIKEAVSNMTNLDSVLATQTKLFIQLAEVSQAGSPTNLSAAEAESIKSMFFTRTTDLFTGIQDNRAGNTELAKKISREDYRRFLIT